MPGPSSRERGPAFTSSSGESTCLFGQPRPAGRRHLPGRGGKATEPRRAGSTAADRARPAAPALPGCPSRPGPSHRRRAVVEPGCHHIPRETRSSGWRAGGSRKTASGQKSLHGTRDGERMGAAPLPRRARPGRTADDARGAAHNLIRIPPPDAAYPAADHPWARSHGRRPPFPAGPPGAFFLNPGFTTLALETCRKLGPSGPQVHGRLTL